jgi:hypothetical protein
MLPCFVIAHFPISKYSSIKTIQKCEKDFCFKAEPLTSIIYYLIRNTFEKTNAVICALIIRAKTTNQDIIQTGCWWLMPVIPNDMGG